MTRRTLRLWGPVAAYMAAIFGVSAMSQPPLPQNVSDKSGHALAYAGLSILAVRALAGGLPARMGANAVVGAVMIAAAYGASDEMHQLFVPGRTADVADWFADATGAAIGAAACWAWGIIATRSRSSRRAPRHEL